MTAYKELIKESVSRQDQVQMDLETILEDDFLKHDYRGIYDIVEAYQELLDISTHVLEVSKNDVREARMNYDDAWEWYHVKCPEWAFNWEANMISFHIYET